MKEPKELGGPELLAACDEVWEDREPRPGAHSGSLSVCVSGSVLGPWGPIVWMPTRVTIIE